MPIWVKLKHQEGQFWDSQIGWGIKLDEVKQLPDRIPSGSLLAGRLRMGALVECDPPDSFNAQLEAVQVPVIEEILKQEEIIVMKPESPEIPEPSTKPKTKKRPTKKPATRKRKP